MVISPIILAVAIIWFVSWLYRRREWYKFSAKLKRFYTSLPFIGHTYLFFGYDQENFFVRLCALFKEAVASEPFFKFWLGPRLAIVITEPEYARRVIFSQKLVDKDDILVATDPIVGQGMLFGSGAKVKKHRKVFMPGFNSKMLENYIKVFHKHSTTLVQALDKYESNALVDIEHHMHYCAFDAVNETTIDVRTNCQTSPEYRQLCHWLIDIYGILFQDIVKPWLYHGRRVLCAIGWKTQVDVTSQALDEHLFDALHKKRADLQSTVMQSFIKKKCEDVQECDDGDEASGSLVSTLEYILKSDCGISDWDLVVELKNIYMASSDTVATTAAFLAKMFAIHPHYQEQAYEECKEVLGHNTTDTSPTLQQLSRLVFMEKCIKETLRLFPIAPLLVRKTTDVVQFDDIDVPLDTTMLIGVYWLHRNPRHWLKPDHFYPEHFSPELCEGRNPGAFLPFSGGAHSCIGQNYATQFLKTMLATLLLNYKLTPLPSDYTAGVIPSDYVSQMKLGSDISVRLVGGVKVTLSRR